MADELPPTGLDPSPESFARTLATLRTHLAELEAAGEEAPPEARELVQRLEALTEALAGLAGTLGDVGQPLAPPPAGTADAGDTGDTGDDTPKR